MNTTKVVSYCRISTSTHGQSTENQSQAIERAGYKVDFHYKEEGVSGSTNPFTRAVFSKMLSELTEGSTVLVTAGDRIVRSVRGILSVVDEFKKRKVKLIVLQYNFDLTSVLGEAMMIMAASFSQIELDSLKHRTRQALAAKRESGVILGKPPTTTPELLRALVLQMQTKQLKDISAQYNISTNTLSKYKKLYYNNREALNEYEVVYARRLKQIETNKEKA